MPTAVCTYLDPVIDSLTVVVNGDAPSVTTSAGARELIDSVALARRLGAVAAVDAIEQIDRSRTYYDQGHPSARVMYAHIAQVSGAEASRLDEIRRMTNDCTDINTVWRKGQLSVDKAAILGRAFTNPRVQQQFIQEQRHFLKLAKRFDLKRFERKIAKWVELRDCDGPSPAPDPSHERRNLTMTQDYFSKAWKLEATLGSLQGSQLNEILQAYTEAEFTHDWLRAERLHGNEASVDLLDRTDAQRRADALIQMAADGVHSDKPSAPVKRIHNIVWNAETLEELIRRWVDGPARILDPGTYNISDIDGHPIAASEAFADLLQGTFRRVIQNAAGVTIDMSKPTRLFTGLARLGVQLTTTECYWPGCCVPTSKCQIDHLKPAARGGQTIQRNGLPACRRHNRFKERGYTVTRGPTGEITITTPTGDTVHYPPPPHEAPAPAGASSRPGARDCVDSNLTLNLTLHMRHDEQVRLIKQLCAHLDAGTSCDAGGLRKLPTSDYTDPELAEREWNEFFLNVPQCLGMSRDLPEPGTFLTNNDLGIPILATRDSDGTFRAFVNSCRHRGVVVETEERGTKRRFMCPFHAWTYDTAGTLVGLPKTDHFGDVDTECLSLIPLPAQERHGLLFVHPDANGNMDLDELLGTWFNDEFLTWGFADLEPMVHDEYDTACNWKLALDTFGETYHFSVLHKNTLFNGFHGNVQLHDEDGHLHRMILCKRGIDTLRHMPEETWDITVAGLPVYWLFPNLILLPVPGGCFMVRMYPDRKDPGRHLSRITFYRQHDLGDDSATSQDKADLMEFVAAAGQRFAEVIRDEDYVMSESQQTSANAGLLPYVIFGRNEPTLHHYHNTYRRWLGEPELPLLDEAAVTAS